MINLNFSLTKNRKDKACEPLNIAADTHVGLIRELNEDSFVYCINDPGCNALVAVADGIGGHDSGNIASNICARMVATAWRNLGLDRESSDKKLEAFLHSEICRANDYIFEINQRYHIQHPMGTTVVSGLFYKGGVLVAHAGDSRCYRYRAGKIERLTEDHSFVAELVKKNIIKPEEAQYHPFAHIISRSIGPAPAVELEVNNFKRIHRDRFMFCSDGLTNHVEDAEIQRIIGKADDAYEAVKMLLKAALRGGGEDNITIVCVFT